MAFMSKYVKKYWILFGITFLVLAVEALSDLLLPTIMARIIDDGIANKDMELILQLGGVMLLITAVGALAACSRNIMASHVSQRFGTELRGDLFRKIQSMSFESIDKFERASLVTRMTNDVTQVQMFVNGMMRIFMKAPLVCIGSLIMAIRLNPSLAIVFAVVIPIVAVLIAINLKLGIPLFSKVQQMLDRVNGAVREYLSGVRVVKAFNRFEFEANKFKGTNDDYQRTAMKAMRTMAVFAPGITLAVNLGIVAVIWIGGIRVDNGQMSVGEIVAFVNYMLQMLFSLMMIANVFTMFVRAKASAVRVGEVFAEENRMTWSEAEAGGGLASRGRVDFENVSFSYAGSSGERVVRNASFSCLPGETIGVIGSTGSGKSSLVGLIPRFYDADSGSVKVNGRDVRNWDPQELRQSIAIVPQKTTLFSGTVFENLLWGKEDATLQEMEQAARLAEAHDFIAAFPEGYETMLGQKGVNLSGGQKQRISIARALIRKPDILILDDCTSAVDASTEMRIKEAMKRYAQGLTCILIAQRITSVMDADKIVVMDDGEIVGIGSHESLLRSCSVYREIYHSQVGKEAN